MGRNLYWLSLSLVVFIADQVSKWVAVTQLAVWVKKPILPFLNICLSFNKGAAFGFLHRSGGWQRWFFVITGVLVCVGIVVWLYRLQKQQGIVSLALALIFGGAIGNLWDRLVLGYVVDFIQVYVGEWYFPTFNLADSAISIGAILILLTLNKGASKI